ncbi:riboflavin kinase [Geosmithia morbida]|uniref:Riboflavin kinase n=1 Tax=Geosmithia morbida TaxID=1094350 RepID=A0A9P4Z2S3_9HYPO|nr:riboflavin kinase [Geosmithia morbida]KAF4125579.1 riboflavin kinase [Geosmithia morbida]
MSTQRPLIVGDDAGPQPPYPLRMEGKVISGFGRGSKELGIPTANLPVDDTVTPWISSVKSGVYFGYASILLPPPAQADGGAQQDEDAQQAGSSTDERGFRIFPMVMSIGYNPFYKNTVRSAEVHVLHDFKSDFYGTHMRLLVLDFVREEKNYDSLDDLVLDIRTDCDVARASLARKSWAPARAKVVDGGDVDGELDVEWLLKDL